MGRNCLASLRYLAVMFPYVAILITASTLATPQQFRISGSLFNSSGVPVTANKDIQVKAYDASSAGTLLWTSSVENTAVNNGQYNLVLDASSGGTSLIQRLSDMASTGSLWFEIDIDTGVADGTMDAAVTVQPRIRARGTLFAVSAGSADALKNFKVAGTTPTDGYVLKWNDGASQWEPGALSGGSSFGIYETTGSCHTDFTEVDSRSTYMCLHGSGEYSADAYVSNQTCPSSPSTAAGSPPTSSFWSAQLATATVKTCHSTTKTACYVTSAGSCYSGFTDVGTMSLNVCLTGSSFYEDRNPVESIIACPTATPTTVAGDPPTSGFWATTLKTSTIRVCCK